MHCECHHGLRAAELLQGVRMGIVGAAVSLGLTRLPSGLLQMSCWDALHKLGL